MVRWSVMSRLWGLAFAWAAIAACSSSEEASGGPPPSDCVSTPCEVPHSPSSATLPDGAPTPVVPTELAITLEPAQVTVRAGGFVDVTVVVARPAGFSEALTLDITNAPPASAIAKGEIPIDATRASFRISLPANNVQGSYVVDVAVRGTAKTATARLPLVVVGAPGALDTAFGQAGIGTSTVDFAVANMGQQADGHIVLGGTSGSASHDFVAVRFDANGAVDSTFGTTGKAVLDSGGDDYAHDMIVQRDGKVVVAGYQYQPESYAMLWGRLNANGARDTAFGTAKTGLVALGPAQYQIVYGLHEQPDGKLLGGGIRYNGVDYSFTVVRLHTTGALDTGFGSGGFGLMEMGSHDYCFGLATDSQGRIVCTGEVYNGAGYDFLAARFTNMGTADTTFSAPNGWVSSITGGGANAFGYASLIQPDGKILVAGSAPGVGQDFAFMRYGDSGTLDATFGNAGKVLLDVGPSDRVYRVALDAQKRIVFVGHTGQDPGSKVVVGRLMPNGAVDSTFGQNGRAILDFTPAPADSDYAQGLLVSSDGRIVVGGHSVKAGVRIPWVARVWD